MEASEPYKMHIKTAHSTYMDHTWCTAVHVMNQFETKTSLKPLDGFEVVWTILKLAGPFKSWLDHLKAGWTI